MLKLPSIGICFFTARAEGDAIPSDADRLEDEYDIMRKRAAKKQGHAPAQMRESISAENREHVESLLDRALADTFPASDPVSTLMPDPSPSKSAHEQRSSSK